MSKVKDVGCLRPYAGLTIINYGDIDLRKAASDQHLSLDSGLDNLGSPVEQHVWSPCSLLQFVDPRKNSQVAHAKAEHLGNLIQ